jgi:glyoxylase-like metal-dependent hydrolase (beta-lactamase superfamily II)
MSMAVGAYQQAPAAGQAPAGQQAPAPKVTLAIEKLKDNLYIIPTGHATGAGFVGGNTLVLVAEKGAVIVDTKLAGYGDQLIKLVRSVTDKPIVMVINTHTHNDHTGSNVELPATAEFVAHEGTRNNLARAECAPVTNCAPFKGDNAKFLPKTTFKDKLSLLSGNDRIDLFYFGRGHTNGDAFILFTQARVLHAGDMFAWKDAPFLDAGSGGSGLEFPETLAKAVKGISGADTVVGGHQPPTTWADFQTWQRFMADVVANIRESHKAGKTVEDAIGALNAANLSAKYPGYATMRAKGAVTAIYAELNATK